MGRKHIPAAITAFALLCARMASADGLPFDGDRPLFPHFVLPLDATQKQLIAAETAKGARYVELRLTPAQQAAAKKEAGATVPWVFAVSREAIEVECTCGAYNLAVVIEDRLAVYDRGLGDHLSPGDLKAIGARLRGPAAPAASEATVGPRTWTRLDEGRARDPVLDALLGRLPGRRFERELRLPRPWRVVGVRGPALPRLGEESDQDLAGLFADQESFSAQPAEGDRVKWPALGARRDEPDGTRLWMVPAILSPGADLRRVRGRSSSMAPVASSSRCSAWWRKGRRWGGRSSPPPAGSARS
jgi:hypothetical protein